MRSLRSQADKAQCTGNGPQATVAGVAINAKTIGAKIILSLTQYGLRIQPTAVAID